MERDSSNVVSVDAYWLPGFECVELFHLDGEIRLARKPNWSTADRFGLRTTPQSVKYFGYFVRDFRGSGSAPPMERHCYLGC